ncbi:MAG: NAD-binding protein, partial [Halalkalicoccus sp.]|nr:NAD-binding protein [Halalkalicoccus sp.]
MRVIVIGAGEVGSSIAADLSESHEVVVVDDHSSDDTGRVAAEAGAQVVAAADVYPEIAGGGGKGEALWRSLHVSKGDIVLWCDADISDIG